MKESQRNRRKILKDLNFKGLEGFGKMKSAVGTANALKIK